MSAASPGHGARDGAASSSPAGAAAPAAVDPGHPAPADTSTARPAGVQSTAVPKTTVKRSPERAVDDIARLRAVLDAGVVAHVAVVDEGLPYALPCAYAPWRDGVLLHGSSASRLFKLLAAGAPACVTVTFLDSWMLARSAFHSGMGYRSAMLFGTATVLTGAEKNAGFEALTEHLLPGRWGHIRGIPLPKEDKATLLVHLRPQQWSLKAADGFAEDEPEDLRDYAHVWAGRIDLRTVAGPATPDPVAAAAEVPLPEHVARMLDS